MPSNDELERRGIAPLENEADLSQSSIPSMAHPLRAVTKGTSLPTNLQSALETSDRLRCYRRSPRHGVFAGTQTIGRLTTLSCLWQRAAIGE